MKTDIQTGFENAAGEDSNASHPLLPALALEAERYMPELSDLEISEDQKRELLTTLWSIMQSCVELGFKVDVVELVCGQSCENCGPDGPTRVE